jgi:hypothetical protein
MITILEKFLTELEMGWGVGGGGWGKSDYKDCFRSQKWVECFFLGAIDCK